MRIIILSILFFWCISSGWSYANISPANVHSLLVYGDSLLILDVREVSEYRDGHIAEPAGYLPVTPVNMPLNSGVLEQNYHLLPKDIDIVVYCRSGGRSAVASSFLESKGFNRIYNMTGGFYSWVYEYRNEGFGNHTGSWVRITDTYPVEISCNVAGNVSKLIFKENALPAGLDSLYFEINYDSSRIQTPLQIPESDLNGVFRLSALNQFGMSQFAGDSLGMSDSVFIYLIQLSEQGDIIGKKLHTYIPEMGWNEIENSGDSTFITSTKILRKWYTTEGYVDPSLIPSDLYTHNPAQFELFDNYPNPFNPVTVFSWQLAVDSFVELHIFNPLGQKVATLLSKKQEAGYHKLEWDASGFPSGTYYYRLSDDSGCSQSKKLILIR